jgi:hypothetical protein
LISLTVLMSRVLLIGITGRAQDSGKTQTADSRPVSGFLGDYSSLAPDPKNGDLLLYEKDRSAMKKYNKFGVILMAFVSAVLLDEARRTGVAWTRSRNRN